MENVQMLVPIAPENFWKQLREIIEQVVVEKSLQKPNNHADRPLLKAKEVCEILHVSKPTLYDWLKQGKIKSVKIQSRRYFQWKDLEELIQQSRVNDQKSRP